MSLRRLKTWLLEHNSHIGFSGLIILVVVGLMNVVHVITYRKPTDGGVWQMRRGALEVVETDLSADTSLLVGDRLVQIDDLDISDIETYEEFLFSALIGSKHLYIVERDGAPYEPWVVIRGAREVARNYYLYAITGFLYLIFILIIFNQDVDPYPKKWLICVSLFVFLGFVFHHTERFSPLDWVSFYLDYTGRVLLPSALFSLVLQEMGGRRKRIWPIHLLHWIPSLSLLLGVLLWVPRLSKWGGHFWGEPFYRMMGDMIRVWGGSLICLALMFLVFPFKDQPRTPKTVFFWVVAWLPFAFGIWQLDYPFSTILAGVSPAVLPIALLFDWSKKGILYLGQIGRKSIIYVCVVLLLFLGYFMFIGVFESLLGGHIPRRGQVIISGFGIIFAAISFSPLKNIGEELLNRLIYGDRFEAINKFLDFSELNRADTSIEAFLEVILERVSQAFGFEKCWTFLRIGEENRFVSVPEKLGRFTCSFVEWPVALVQGQPMSGVAIREVLVSASSADPFLPTNTFYPLRVSGKVRVLLVLPGGPQDPSLSPEETRMLNNFLNQCEVLMDNMELYQTLSQKALSITELKEYNENIIESTRIGILTTNDSGAAVSCNEAFSDLVGLSREEILGKPFERLLKRVEIHAERIVKSGFALEGRFQTHKGKSLILDIQQTALKTRKNETYGTLYLVEDIEEKKQIQEQLMQQEKLASIGFLAAGVAHEINTPLTGIASYSQLLASETHCDTEQVELVDLIQEQTHRAVHIVKELLNFSRKETSKKGPVDAVQVLRQTISFLEHQFRKRQVNLHQNLMEKGPTIDGYGNQLQQVFVNIMVNAMDSMSEGGDIFVEDVLNNGEYQLIFRDSGIGMDEETQSRIFDPFFTTKEVGKGTGLGLSVVYNILQNHQATIEVESSLGCGTTVIVSFPVLEQNQDKSV